MKTCEVNFGTVRNGIVNRAQELLAEGLSVTSVNERFGEQLVTETETDRQINPSEALVNQYVEHYNNPPTPLKDTPPKKGDYASKTLKDNDLALFRKLQNANLVSKKSITYNFQGQDYTAYSIPKTKITKYVQGEPTGFEYEKNYEKARTVIRLMNKYKMDFINLVETKNAILVQIGDFKEELPEVDESPVPEEISVPIKKPSLTRERVLSFLKNIGFTNIQSVKNLVHNGEPLQGTAYVDLIQGVMQIVEGKEDVALPEESMHVLIELIQQSAPELYRAMQKEVVNYQLYRDTINNPEYTGEKWYQKDGHLDYDKIKNEVMAKLLANYLVNNLEGIETNRDKIVAIKNWWQMLVDWVKGLFSKYKNPFKEALARLEKDDNAFGVFKDLTTSDHSDLYFMKNPVRNSVEERDEEYKYTKDAFENIKNQSLGWTKGPDEKGQEVYFKDGVKFEGKRVSDEVKEFNEKLFRNKPPFTEEEKAANAALAADGDYIHALFEDAGKALVDDKTGLLRSTPLGMTDSLFETGFEKAIGNRIFKWMQEYLHEYPEGTRFLIETIISDPSRKITGTVDFMAIVPDTTNKSVKQVDINDWKTKKSLEDVKDYKKEGWKTQINAYKKILSSESYKVKDFGKLRATPIERVYTKGGILRNIEIGEVDPNNVENTRLRPVISDEETTGDKVKDRVIQSLGKIYNEFVKMLKAKKIPTRQILNEIDDAIYELRVSNGVENLTAYIRQFATKVAETSRAIKANQSKDLNVINGLLAEVNLYRKLFDNLSEVNKLVLHSSREEGANRTDLNALRRAYGDVGILMEDLDEGTTNLLSILADENNVFHLTSPEKVVGMVPALFRATGDHDVATIRLLYELAKKSYNRIDFEADAELKNLKALKYKFDAFLKDKGLSVGDATGLLVNYEKGTLHSKISKDFYDERKRVFDSKNAAEISKFVRTNYDITKWSEWYEAEFAAQSRLWDSISDSVDKAESDRLREYKKAQFEQNYNILKNPLTAFNSFNKLVWSKNINEELWLSDAYKKIASEPVLLEIYNHFLTKNKELSDVGGIQEHDIYTFLPNVRKGIADIFSIEDSNFLVGSGKLALQEYNNFKKSIRVNDYQLNFLGEVDEKGEKQGKRFIPYVTGLDSFSAMNREVAEQLGIGKKNENWDDLYKKIQEYRAKSKENDARFADAVHKNRQKSFDLFKIYGLMGKEIAKEKYLQEIDEVLRALKYLEENKKNYATNKFGRGKVKNGEYVLDDKPGQNAALFTKYYKYLVEGEALQVDNDFTFKFSLKNLWNKTPLGKLHHFDLDESDKAGISAVKFTMMLNNFNIKKTLGLNFAAGISNLFGSTWGTHRLYSNKVTEGDLYKAWMQLTSGAFHQSEDMKKRAAFVDYFLPLLNNREGFKSDQLSVNQATRLLSNDWIMWTQRKGDELVQINVFLAHLENAGLIDGKIVHLREEALKQVRPDDYWKKSPTERKEIDKAVEKRFEGLKEQYALTKLATFREEEVNGKKELFIELPGVERTGNEVAEFRGLIQTISKDATGAIDEFDMGSFRFSVIGRLAGTFKNWIPRMGDVRWSEFHYSQSHHSYEYGRFRMFARALSANWLASVAKVVPIPFLTDAVTKNLGKQDYINRAIEIYQEKRAEAERQGKLDVFMTEDQFITRYLHGVEASFAEVRVFSLLLLVFMSSLLRGDDDDDPEQKAAKKLLRRQIDKLGDEIGFFFNPRSAIDIAAAPFPITGLIKDMYSLTGHVLQQTLGFTLNELGYKDEGEKLMKGAHPMKYTFKLLPALKEFINYIPTWDPQLAKDWGITLTSQRGF